MTARQRARLTKGIIGGVTFVLLLLTGCARQHLPQDTFNAQGPVAAKEAGLYWVVFWIAAVVFVLVEGLLIVAMVRWRHQPGRGVPRQVHGNHARDRVDHRPGRDLRRHRVPTVADHRVAVAMPAGALEIEVVGHQWWWEVHYPGRRESRRRTRSTSR